MARMLRMARTPRMARWLADYPDPTDHRPGKIHNLISVPLSSRAQDKIQSKIWTNEYIDLGTLLPSLPGDPKYNFTVKSSGSNQPLVSLEPVQNSKRITSIDQWTTAFQVFVAVYTIRFPDSAPGLMKYSATVRDLAAKNAHWRYYDENFRYLRQKSLFPWDEVHWELWLQAHHMTKLSSSNNPPNSFHRQSKQPFREDSAGNSTKVKDVLAVISNTSALNVEAITQPQNASRENQLPPPLALLHCRIQSNYQHQSK